MSDPRKKDFGVHDKDLEHLIRDSSLSLPPRVVLPAQVERFGFALTELNALIHLLRGEYFDYETETMKNCHSAHSIECKIENRQNARFGDTLKLAAGPKVFTASGDITIHVSRLEMNAAHRRHRHPSSFPPGWQDWFKAICVDSFIYQYMDSVFPKHIHFILKKTMGCPLPFPYMEFYMKGANADGGNILADYAAGDTTKDSILKI